MNDGSEVIIFDRTGRILTRLRASVHRWWRLNEYGGAEFDLPVTDPKATRRNLQFGNLLLVRRAGLPDWGGVIDTPREWGNNTVSITAYGAEYLLTFRLPGGDHGAHLSETAGLNFQEIIARANRPEDLNIRIGQVDVSGAARDDKLLPWNENGLYDDVCTIAEESGFEWAILPKYDSGGRLFWEAIWIKKRGRATNFTLREGQHIISDSIVLSEQGKIISHFLAIGEGSDPNSPPRHMEPVDYDSAGDYGLREGSETFTQEMSMDALKENARVRAAYWKQPRFTASLTVADVGTAFNALDIGNTVDLSLAGMGFQAAGGFGWTGSTRITGMDYDDEENTVELTSEEAT